MANIRNYRTNTDKILLGSMNIFTAKTLVIGIFIGIIIGLLSLTILVKNNIIMTKTYAYVNTSKVIEEVKNNLKDKELDPKQLQIQLDNAKNIFDQELANYASQNNAIIFASKVIKGATDITNIITPKVLAGLSE